MSFFLPVHRNNRPGRSGPVPQRRPHYERLPPPQHSISAGHNAAQRRAPSSGSPVYEARRRATLCPIGEKGTLPKTLAPPLTYTHKTSSSFILSSLLLLHCLSLLWFTEPHSQGPDWLWPSGCQRNGVFSPEEVRTQRPGCTELHVSTNLPAANMSGIETLLPLCLSVTLPLSLSRSLCL